MFDALSERFERLSTSLRSRGRLSDADLDEALADVRSALLEADVELGVVRAFLDAVRERLSGEALSQSLSPGQQVIKAVNEQLIEVLGGTPLKVTYASKPPTVVLLAGLQGAGKTTAAAKLAAWFKQQGRQPYLIAADLQRPAAVEQLRVLAQQVGVDVYSDSSSPLDIARKGVAEAARLGRDVVIIDTAGRLSVDEALMDEVRAISKATSPHYTFLVIDAVTGQDAVQTARAFHDALSLSGLIVTKLDYDARGGAVLSARGVVGRPVVFASTGEKISDFDLFYPDRMASRILGMGDVLSLIEQAERTMDPSVAESAGRMMSGTFTLDDFLAQLNQVRKMGSLGGLMKLMPGVSKEMRTAASNVDEGELNRVEAIVRSMTPKERRDPSIIDGSRRTRIAKGSATSVSAVNQLLKQFGEMRKMMRQMGNGGTPAMPAGMGRMAGLAARARNEQLPPGFEALGAGMASAASAPRGGGGGKNKKKKGGRVTPPKQR